MQWAGKWIEDARCVGSSALWVSKYLYNNDRGGTDKGAPTTGSLRKGVYSVQLSIL